jgi:hypothetical protein
MLIFALQDKTTWQKFFHSSEINKMEQCKLAQKGEDNQGIIRMKG